MCLISTSYVSHMYFMCTSYVLHIYLITTSYILYIYLICTSLFIKHTLIYSNNKSLCRAGAVFSPIPCFNLSLGQLHYQPCRLTMTYLSLIFHSSTHKIKQLSQNIHFPLKICTPINQVMPLPQFNILVFHGLWIQMIHKLDQSGRVLQELNR